MSIIPFKTQSSWSKFTAPVTLSNSVQNGYQTATFQGLNADGEEVVEIITAEVRDGLPIKYEHRITRTLKKEPECRKTRTRAKRSSSPKRRRSG